MSIHDKTFMNEIKPFDKDLDVLAGINVYDSIDSLFGNRTIGLIAQNVEEVFEEAVHMGQAGVKSVDTNAIIGLLVNSVNVLSRKVDNLELRLNELEGKENA